MVDEAALQREGALLEVVMVMRRQLGRVARANLWTEHVHHEGRAAEDSAKTTGLVGHIQTVMPDAPAILWHRPGREGRNMAARLVIGPRIHRCLGQIGRKRGEKPCYLAALRQGNRAVARRQ